MARLRKAVRAAFLPVVAGVVHPLLASVCLNLPVAQVVGARVAVATAALVVVLRVRILRLVVLVAQAQLMQAVVVVVVV
jgi:hypothetical protein